MSNLFPAALAILALVGFGRPAVAQEWSGCYAGIDLGAARARSTATDLPYAQGPYTGASAWNGAGQSVSVSGSHAALGASLGCDRQVGTFADGAFVIGGVWDIAVLHAGGEAGFGGSGQDTFAAFEVNSAASLRLRAGYAQDDRFYYLTGGFAQGEIDVSAQDDTGPAMMQVSGGGGSSGWVAGMGVEWRVAQNRSLNASLLHYDFGSLTATGEARDPAGAYPRFEHEVTADILRLGMNWWF